MTELSDDLRTKAAWLYYKEGMTQDQVAQELGLNRAKVLRMLAASRMDGTVQIRVLSKQSACIALERELERKFGLERAIVVPVPKQLDLLPDIIGGVLGEYLTDILMENMTIGLGWGKTLSACLPAVPQQSDAHVSVVSLLGGLTRVSAFNPSEFAWRLGDRLAAEAYLIAAPVFAPDERTRDALLTHPGIREVFRRSENLDVAIVSVGDLSPGSTFSRIGAKSEIARIVREMADAGVAVIVISSELEELLALSDRLLVLHNGRIFQNVRRQDINSEEELHHAIQGHDLRSARSESAVA